jgi:carbon storage regulator
MLVLTRKTGQKIIINDNIEVTILEVKGDSIRVGIEAPRDITIYRHEIYEEIKNENLRTAKQSSLDDVTKALNLLQNDNRQTSFDIFSNNLNK